MQTKTLSDLTEGAQVRRDNEPRQYEEEAPRPSCGSTRENRKVRAESMSDGKRSDGEKGRRPIDRRRPTAARRSPALLPPLSGYFRYGAGRGLAFITYNWTQP